MSPMTPLHRWLAKWGLPYWFTKLSLNLGLKVLSFLIAVLLWFIVLGSRNVEVTKEVALEIQTPSDLVVVNELPDKVAFRISGPKAFLRNILNRRDNPIRVNLQNAKPGRTTYRFFTDNIQVPLGVKVLFINPAAISVQLEEMKLKEVPVRLVTVGHPLPGHIINSIELETDTVTLKGGSSELSQVSEVLTTPFDLGLLHDSGEREISLDLSQHSRLRLEGPFPRIKYSVTVTQQSLRVRNLKIKVLTQRKHKVLTKDASIFFNGPTNVIQSLMKRLQQDHIVLEIDLNSEGDGVFEVEAKAAFPKRIEPLLKELKVTLPKVKVVLY